MSEGLNEAAAAVAAREPCVECGSMKTGGCATNPCGCSCHGPTRYEQLGAELGRLVAQKQLAYGDSFGKAGAVMLVLYPEGIPPSKMHDALTVVRVIDKLFRIATDRDALGESPWRDVAGYGLLGASRAGR